MLISICQIITNLMFIISVLGMLFIPFRSLRYEYFNRKLSYVIIKNRTNKGLSQKELANTSGLSKETIAHLEGFYETVTDCFMNIEYSFEVSSDLKYKNAMALDKIKYITNEQIDEYIDHYDLNHNNNRLIVRKFRLKKGDFRGNIFEIYQVCKTLDVSLEDLKTSLRCC